MPADGAFCYILKRLSDAERDNDKIYGVISGVHVSSAGPAEGGFYCILFYFSLIYFSFIFF
jgi:acyl transferase domain-containing protein